MLEIFKTVHQLFQTLEYKNMLSLEPNKVMSFHRSQMMRLAITATYLIMECLVPLLLVKVQNSSLFLRIEFAHGV